MRKAMTDDYFHVLRENNLYKMICVSLSVLIMVILLPLIYGVIWFERFGSDKKRTLLNMLVSSACWTVILCGIMLQVPDIVHIVIGPLPATVCFFQAVLRSAFASEFLFYFDAIVVVRFVYIFCLKNPANVCDEFWYQVVTRIVIVYCILTRKWFKRLKVLRCIQGLIVLENHSTMQ
jgi:hypothetical protein